MLYASHPEFAQTNVSPGTISEGTGGFTERARSRIVLPFAPGLGETDHVLGHELAHAFQIDIAKRAHQNAFELARLVHRRDGRVPVRSVRPTRSPTCGSATRSCITGCRRSSSSRTPVIFRTATATRSGRILGSVSATRSSARLLRAKARTIVERLEEVTGETRDELTRDWHASIPMAEGDPDVIVRPRQIITSAEGGRVHVAPAISPDGRQIMFISERDRLSLDLFVADVTSGAVVKKVISTATDPHFDSLQYIQSAGSWDSAGRRFVVAAVLDGGSALSIIEMNGSVAAPRHSSERHRGDLQPELVA